MLHIARQEMAHLGMVSNLLTAIGGRPHFQRPNFPQPALPHRPFPFMLERFSDSSLQRFIRAETPQPQVMLIALEAVPRPPEFDYTGELYRKIEKGFEDLAADLASRNEELFIGPPAGQDAGQWSTSVTTYAVTDLPSAKQVIAQIINEGEGAPVGSPTSHWAIFKRIAADLVREEYKCEARAGFSFSRFRNVQHGSSCPGRGGRVPSERAGIEMCEHGQQIRSFGCRSRDGSETALASSLQRRLRRLSGCLRRGRGPAPRDEHHVALRAKQFVSLAGR